MLKTLWKSDFSFVHSTNETFKLKKRSLLLEIEVINELSEVLQGV